MTLDASAKANDDLIRRFMNAWECRDSDFIIGCLAEDAVYHSMPLTPIVGKEAVAAWVRGFAGKPAGHLQVRHQVAASDIVMNERTDVIVLNGKTVTLPICAVFEMQGGRIRAWREYFDLAPAAAAYKESPDTP